MVRYWGYYSNASRGKRRAAARRLAPVPDPMADTERALEHEEEPFRRILAHIQMPAQRPEPLAHSPPLQDELSYA